MDIKKHREAILSIIDSYKHYIECSEACGKAHQDEMQALQFTLNLLDKLSVERMQKIIVEADEKGKCEARPCNSCAYGEATAIYNDLTEGTDGTNLTGEK